MCWSCWVKLEYMLWHDVTEMAAHHGNGITSWKWHHVMEMVSRHGIGITSWNRHHIMELASCHGNRHHVTEMASCHGISITLRNWHHITESESHRAASQHKMPGKRSCILSIGYQITDSDCNYPDSKIWDSTPKKDINLLLWLKKNCSSYHVVKAILFMDIHCLLE